MCLAAVFIGVPLMMTYAIRFDLRTAGARSLAD
jgi:hypothetical protein